MSSYLRLNAMIFVEDNFLIFYISDAIVGYLNCRHAFRGMFSDDYVMHDFYLICFLVAFIYSLVDALVTLLVDGELFG